MPMAHEPLERRATCTPGARRRSSGRTVMPERRVSSEVMTKTEAAVEERRCAFLDTEVTSMFISSSRLRSANPFGSEGAGVCPAQRREIPRRKNPHIRPNTILMSLIGLREGLLGNVNARRRGRALTRIHRSVDGEVVHFLVTPEHATGPRSPLFRHIEHRSNLVSCFSLNDRLLAFCDPI